MKSEGWGGSRIVGTFYLASLAIAFLGVVGAFR